MIGLMSRVLSVLDTGAGPNLIRKSELPAGLETLVSFGPTQDIGGANNRLFRTAGTIKLLVRPGSFMATAEFIACRKLAVLLILGVDYCDLLVEAIYSRKKIVELADFSKVPIVRRVVPWYASSFSGHLSANSGHLSTRAYHRPGRPYPRVKIYYRHVWLCPYSPVYMCPPPRVPGIIPPN